MASAIRDAYAAEIANDMPEITITITITSTSTSTSTKKTQDYAEEKN